MPPAGPPSGLKGSWEWLALAGELPARAIPLIGSSGTIKAFPGRCIYLGIVAVNSATAAGSIVIYDGQDATGAPIGATSIAASGVANSNAQGKGVLCEIGVAIVVTGAVITGSVLVIPLWHYDFTPPGE